MHLNQISNKENFLCLTSKLFISLLCCKKKKTGITNISIPVETSSAHLNIYSTPEIQTLRELPQDTGSIIFEPRHVRFQKGIQKGILHRK